MRRAVETAEILFRDIPPERVEGLEEIDFGRFEGKTWTELSDDRDYARWIESGGTAPFPEGESREAFIERVVNAFTQAVLARPNAERIAFVVHGGCVMAILSRLTDEDYFKFQAETTCGYEVVLDIDLDSGDEADASRIRVLSYRSLDARVRA